MTDPWSDKSTYRLIHTDVLAIAEDCDDEETVEELHLLAEELDKLAEFDENPPDFSIEDGWRTGYDPDDDATPLWKRLFGLD